MGWVTGSSVVSRRGRKSAAVKGQRASCIRRGPPPAHRIPSVYADPDKYDPGRRPRGPSGTFPQRRWLLPQFSFARASLNLAPPRRLRPC